MHRSKSSKLCDALRLLDFAELRLSYECVAGTKLGRAPTSESEYVNQGEIHLPRRTALGRKQPFVN